MPTVTHPPTQNAAGTFNADVEDGFPTFCQFIALLLVTVIVNDFLGRCMLLYVHMMCTYIYIHMSPAAIRSLPTSFALRKRIDIQVDTCDSEFDCAGTDII